MNEMNDNLRIKKIIAVYADYQGYSICVVGWNDNNPVGYHVLSEYTSMNFYPNELNTNIQVLKELYPVSDILVNNQNVADFITAYSSEIKTFAQEQGILNLMGLINDSRITFSNYKSIYQEEIDKFSPEKISYRLNALFMGLNEKPSTGYQVSIAAEDSGLSEIEGLFSVDPSVGRYTTEGYWERMGYDYF